MKSFKEYITTVDEAMHPNHNKIKEIGDWTEKEFGTRYKYVPHSDKKDEIIEVPTKTEGKITIKVNHKNKRYDSDELEKSKRG